MDQKYRRSFFFFGISAVVISITLAGVFLIPSETNYGDAQDIYMEAKQFEYIPRTLNVTVGEHLVINIKSLDVPHGFEIKEFGVRNHVIPVGEYTTIEFTVDKTGNFTFYCTVFCGVGHSDHYGYMVVSA